MTVMTDDRNAPRPFLSFTALGALFSTAHSSHSSQQPFAAALMSHQSAPRSSQQFAAAVRPPYAYLPHVNTFLSRTCVRVGGARGCLRSLLRAGLGLFEISFHHLLHELLKTD
jgi:hypothetical protein